MVRNLSAVRETWLQFLGWEDPLEKEMTTYFMDRGIWQVIVHGLPESDMT